MTTPEPAQRRSRHGALAARPGPFVTDDTDHGVNVRIVSGAPTPDEIAAVTAVITAAVVEESAAADAVPSSGPSAWQRSQRILRTPLMAGPGRWRNFSG